MDAALMGDVPETSTQKNPSNGKDVNEIESQKDDDACHEILSTSTSTPKKAGKGVAMDEMDKDRITSFQYVQNALLYAKMWKLDGAVHVSMDGMTLNPSRTDLQNVFKERGWMSNLLFLLISLARCEHWFCVVINLVDKRIDVLNSMNLKSEEKVLAIADVVSTFLLFVCRAMVLSFVETFEFKCDFVMYLFCCGQVSVLFNVFKRTRLMDYPWKNWIIHHPNVPQQSNMFMEHWTGGRMNTRKLKIDEGNNDGPLHALLSPLDAWFAHQKVTTRDDLPVIHMRRYPGVMSRNSFWKWRRAGTEPPPTAVGRREDQRRLLRLDYTLGLYNRSDNEGVNDAHLITLNYTFKELYMVVQIAPEWNEGRWHRMKMETQKSKEHADVDVLSKVQWGNDANLPNIPNNPSMQIMVWDCCGCTTKEIIRTIRAFICIHDPDIVVLVGAPNIEQRHKKFGPLGHMRVTNIHSMGGGSHGDVLVTRGTTGFINQVLS
ncbi:hypothetical protein RHMOL_Rhmol09G0111500 [Rhododendron molle]|uniref:Uncharacterized protein n=1 Tax=Rhododendron molle TaxID=49168 RepID=A0ACC0MC51_RHOML|nr:hypothetical protein RHMOL_Rhmol09G0111500 [Rhododendron molle]